MLKLGVNLRTIPVTSNYSVTIFDDVINANSVSGNIQISLPDATLVPGKLIVICKISSDTNLVTVVPIGSQTLDGGTQFSFNQNRPYQFASINGNWLTIGAGIAAMQNALASNLVINGNFDFMQRGASITVSASQLNYGLDRFFGYSRLGGSPGVLTITQNSDVPTLAQSGFQSAFSMNIACSTADNTMASGSVYMTGHKIEGFNAAPMFGKIGYLSFWVKSNISGGPFSVTFQNGAGNRSWYSTFSINATNTWEKKTVVVDFTSESAGATWAIDNTAGINIGVVLAANHTNVSTLNQWTNATAYHVTGQSTTFMSSTSNFMRFSQFMFSEAQGATFTRTGRSIGHEFQLCQRYYERDDGAPMQIVQGNGGANYGQTVTFQVHKRIAPPTIIYSGTWNNLSNVNVTGSLSNYIITNRSFNTQYALATSTTQYVFGGTWTADAEL